MQLLKVYGFCGEHTLENQCSMAANLRAEVPSIAQSDFVGSGHNSISPKIEDTGSHGSREAHVLRNGPNDF